jgi:large subunit ribosomal protein L3
MNTTETKTENQKENSSADLPQYMLGRKQGMTQVFTEDGRVHPATKVAAGPLVVTQVKTVESDGYQAYQFGFEETDPESLTKPERGHQKEALDGNTYYSVLKEYRFDDEVDLSADVGDEMTVDTFSTGDVVDVTGTSKGKGFQGVVGRHGFSGGPRTHGGQKSPERGPGSIGATGDSHVRKGTKMAGRGGGERTTVQNLEIVHVDTDEDMLYIRGGLPGPDGGLLELTAAGS